MNTDPKNTNPGQRAPSHPELTSPNNNPRRLYEVTVHRTEHYHLMLRVEASSEAEAENMAEKLAKRRQNDEAWELTDCDFHACSVKVRTEGGRGNE